MQWLGGRFSRPDTRCERANQFVVVLLLLFFVVVGCCFIVVVVVVLGGKDVSFLCCFVLPKFLFLFFIFYLFFPKLCPVCLYTVNIAVFPSLFSFLRATNNSYYIIV